MAHSHLRSNMALSDTLSELTKNARRCKIERLLNYYRVDR